MKILIVDDEETITSYFSQLAEINGFDQIDCVNSGEEAMTQVLRSVYDVITLDIQMPGASGLEIIAMLRNMCPHAIIAVVSGFLPETMSEDISSCIDVLISKPVNVETFSTLLQKAQQIQSAMNDIRALGIAPDSLN
ncbi:MAG: response regulator [Candidatus Latescibacterota bacterium]